MQIQTSFNADFDKALVPLRFGISYIAIIISELKKSFFFQSIYQTKIVQSQR